MDCSSLRAMCCVQCQPLGAIDLKVVAVLIRLVLHRLHSGASCDAMVTATRPLSNSSALDVPAADHAMTSNVLSEALQYTNMSIHGMYVVCTEPESVQSYQTRQPKAHQA